MHDAVALRGSGAVSGRGAVKAPLFFCKVLKYIVQVQFQNIYGNTTSGQLNIVNRVYSKTAEKSTILEVPIDFYVKFWVYKHSGEVL